MQPTSDKIPSNDANFPAEGLKFLVVDDHYLVREGLKLTIRQLDHHAQVIEAENVMQAAECYRLHPDIDLVLLDLGMQGASGTDSLDAMFSECPDAKVVVVSASHDLRTVQSALKRGVCGYIPKMTAASSLLNALKFVLNGDIYVPPEVFLAEHEPNSMNPLNHAPETEPRDTPETPQAAGLTARQIEVLRLLLEGMSNKQICRELGLALGTVKSHVAAILQTLGASTRSQAVAAVENLGWRAQIIGTDNA